MRAFVAAAAAAFVIAAVAPAAASGLYPIYIERQRGTTLVLEHTPRPAVAAARVSRTAARPARAALKRGALRRPASVRRVTARRINRDSGAIAGGCRDGGLVRRTVGGERVTLQREVCYGVSIRLTGPYVAR